MDEIPRKYCETRSTRSHGGDRRKASATLDRERAIVLDPFRSLLTIITNFAWIACRLDRDGGSLTAVRSARVR